MHRVKLAAWLLELGRVKTTPPGLLALDNQYDEMPGELMSLLQFLATPAPTAGRGGDVGESPGKPMRACAGGEYRDTTARARAVLLEVSPAATRKVT